MLGNRKLVWLVWCLVPLASATVSVGALGDLGGPVQVRVVGPREAGRFGPAAEYRIEIEQTGGRRTLVLPLSAGTSAVDSVFVMGGFAFVVGADPGGWQVHRFDLTTLRLVASIRSASPPAVSPNRRVVAYRRPAPRGIRALRSDTVVLLDTANATTRVVFPEPFAYATTDLLPEPDWSLTTTIDNPLLWTADSTRLLLVCRPHSTPGVLHLAVADVTEGLPKPAITRWAVQLPPARLAREGSQNPPLIAAERLEWCGATRVRLLLRDGRGGAPFSVEAEVAAPATPFAVAVPLSPLLGEGDLPGMEVRLTTPYRWFVGVAPDHSLQYADGLLQLLVDDKSQVVATARYVTLKDPTDGPRAAAFLASLLGIRVHALPSEGVCVCPGTACWISEERDPMRLFFQHGPLLVFVSAYDRSAWDETGGGAGPSVKERVLHDIAETLAAKAAQ